MYLFIYFCNIEHKKKSSATGALKAIKNTLNIKKRENILHNGCRNLREKPTSNMSSINSNTFVKKIKVNNIKD